MRSFAWLGVRQLSADRAVPLVLALVIAILSFLGTAAPRALRVSEDAQVPHDIASYPGILSEVAVATSGIPVFQMTPPEGAPASRFGDGDTRLWQALDSSILALREAQAEPLRSMLGDPEYVTTTTASDSVPPTPGSDLWSISVTFHTTPALADHAELVDGRWPEAMPELEYYQGDGVWSLDELSGWWNLQDHDFPPAEFVMSQAAAERTGWEVGETRSSGSYFGDITLVGTFEPIDPAAELWYRAPYGPAPFITDDPTRGLAAVVGGFLNPAWGDLLPAPDIPRIGMVATVMWLPITGEAPVAEDLDLVQAQANAFDQSGQVIGQNGVGTDLSVRFDSPLPELLSGTADRIEVARTLIALLAIGPAVVGIAVLVLGTRLVVDRRRTALEQLASRGGSVRQLAGSAAVEGTAVALPGATIGVVLAMALVRVPFRPLDVVAAVVLVIAAVWLLTSTTRGVVLGLGIAERQDLTRSAGRARRVVEATVVVLSLAVLGIAAQRGLAVSEEGESAAEAAAAGGGIGIALLSPVALMALAVILVLRLYPHIVRWAEHRAHAGRGTVPFVALARSTRTPAGGLVPVVALVVGVSVGLFSAILTSTVDRGTQAAQWAAVGADLRLDGPTVTDEVREQMAGLEGVREVARAGQASWTILTVDGTARSTPVVYVETNVLREVQRDVVDLEVLPAELADVGETIPAVVTPGTGLEVGDTSLTLNGKGVEVIAVRGEIPGIAVGTSTIVVDAAADREGFPWTPRSAYMALDSGTDTEAVQEQVRGLVRAGVFTERDGYGTGFDGSPIGDALVVTQIGAVGIAAAFVGLVLVLTQMLDAPRRARVVAVLRTVGLRRNQAAQLAAWELAPTVVVSVIAGAAVGMLVPWMVSATTDLTPLTGGDLVPRLALDPALVGGVLGVIVLVAALAVGVSAWVAGRASIGTELREVGE